MDNFDLKKYLAENKLSSNNRVDETETGKDQLLRFYLLKDPSSGSGDVGTVGYVMVPSNYWNEDGRITKEGWEKIEEVLGIDPYNMGMQRYTEAEHQEAVEFYEAKLEKIKNIIRI